MLDPIDDKDNATQGAIVLQAASSLEQADEHSLLYVDRQGQVQPLSLYRRRVGMFWLFRIALIASIAVLYGTVGGAMLGASASGLSIALLGYQHSINIRLQRTAALLSQRRYEEAALQLHRLLRGRLFRRYKDPAIYQQLSDIARLQGHYEKALEYVRKALRGATKSPVSVQEQLSVCSEITLLCNLERWEEALQRLQALQPVLLPGSLVQFRYRVARLYVDLGRGQTDISEEALWSYAQQALRTNVGATLLALCSWAYEQRGDQEMAEHLFQEAWNRQEQDPAFGEHPYPFVWHWVQAQTLVFEQRRNSYVG